MKRIMIVGFVCSLAVSIFCFGSDVAAPSLAYIDNFPISNMLAGNLARRHYITDDKAIKFNIIHAEVSVIHLGFNIQDFAKENQKVWEVKLFGGNPEKFMLLGLIYVHPETGNCHFAGRHQR